MGAPRFIDSLALFGGEVGGGTNGNIDCQWCGKKYTEREVNGEPVDEAPTINFDRFGDKQICDCCFGELETAVLRAMPRILPWYIGLLKTKRKELEKAFGDLANLKQILNEL